MLKSIDYNTILSDLKARKEDLHNEIKGLEIIIKNISKLAGADFIEETSLESSEDNSNLSMVSSYEGAIRILAEKGKPMTTKQILEELENRGKVSKAANKMTSLYSALYGAKDKRMKKYEDGRWGLTYWNK